MQARFLRRINFDQREACIRRRRGPAGRCRSQNSHGPKEPDKNSQTDDTHKEEGSAERCEDASHGNT